MQTAGNTVILSLQQGFTTLNPINVTITVNSSRVDSDNGSKPREVVQNLGTGNLVLGPGFKSGDILAVSSSGVGGVQVHGIAAENLVVTASG